MKEQTESNKVKLTPAQQFVMDKFTSNSNFDCCIHKHWRSKAWFQVNSRSCYEVSDQTIKSLVKKGLIYQDGNNHWRLVNTQQQ